MTDTGYGWRKNAKDTCAVEIGEKILKVLSCESNDIVTQRHERF